MAWWQHLAKKGLALALDNSERIDLRQVSHNATELIDLYSVGKNRPERAAFTEMPLQILFIRLDLRIPLA